MDLSGNIILKENDSRHQFMYASQNYETLYAIYGKFTVTKLPGNKTYLSRIDLQLINYKGPLNIGFTQQDQTSFNQNPIGAHNNLNFDVHVKGLSQINTASITLTSTSNPDGIDTSSFNNIQVFRLLHPLSNGNAFNAQVFDNEFYYRDGTDIVKRPIRPGMAADGQPAAIVEDDPQVLMLSGPQCHHSFLEVFTP